jgi:hypothetical protein
MIPVKDPMLETSNEATFGRQAMRSAVTGVHEEAAVKVEARGLTRWSQRK